jgi:ribosomal protein L32E
MRQIGYGSNKKTRHLMPSGHKAFLVSNGTSCIPTWTTGLD